ncbi:hypothetical protein [Adonisia turfae]|nr:hypothetical protein [Adonisia turfae]
MTAPLRVRDNADITLLSHATVTLLMRYHGYAPGVTSTMGSLP